MANIYDYSVPKTDGCEQSLKDYEGKVMLIVNTATGCGFTPHYEPMEDLRSSTFPATSSAIRHREPMKRSMSSARFITILSSRR